MSLTQLLAISPLGDTIYRYNKQLKEFEEFEESRDNLLIEMKMYKQLYDEHNINQIADIFDIETCVICKNMQQSIKTCCGHKYCHSCFIMRHIKKTWWAYFFSSSSLCNFCSEQIGYTIYIYDEDNDINEINEYVLK